MLLPLRRQNRWGPAVATQEHRVVRSTVRRVWHSSCKHSDTPHGSNRSTAPHRPRLFYESCLQLTGSAQACILNASAVRIQHAHTINPPSGFLGNSRSLTLELARHQNCRAGKFVVARDMHTEIVRYLTCVPPQTGGLVRLPVRLAGRQDYSTARGGSRRTF